MSPGYVLSVTIICISSFPWNCAQYKGMLHGTFGTQGARTFTSPRRKHHVQRMPVVSPRKGRANEEGKEQGVQTLQPHIVFVERQAVLHSWSLTNIWLCPSYFWEEDPHFLWYLWLEICSHFIILPVIITSYILSNSWLGKIFNHQAKCIWDTFLEIYFNIKFRNVLQWRGDTQVPNKMSGDQEPSSW